MYTINIERKKLLKQKREKDRKLGKENFLTALKAGQKADRASNDTQSSAHSNDELINGANADTITQVDNIDNIEIVVENVTKATTNADNIDNVEIKNEKPEEVVMSDDNIDNTTMSNNNTDDAALGNDNAENVTTYSRQESVVWFEEHKDKFVDLTTLKTMFFRGITLGERQKGINCNHGTYLSLTFKRLMLMNILICLIH